MKTTNKVTLRKWDTVLKKWRDSFNERQTQLSILSIVDHVTASFSFDCFFFSKVHCFSNRSYTSIWKVCCSFDFLYYMNINNKWSRSSYKIYASLIKPTHHLLKTYTQSKSSSKLPFMRLWELVKSWIVDSADKEGFVAIHHHLLGTDCIWRPTDLALHGLDKPSVIASSSIWVTR